MKIASFNVENLFDRARIFNENVEFSNQITKAIAELSNLIEQPVYTEADKSRIKELIIELGLDKSDESKFVVLRQNRGKLLSRPKNKPFQIAAGGSQDWIGWLSLKTEPVNEISILNTAQVIRDVDADVMVVIEAEDRVALKQYSEILLKRVQGKPYEEVMVIDGNDSRGIDVGIMTKNGYKIQWMQSHVHDCDSRGKSIFSRDCPEYMISTPAGEEIWVLPNHFKSKFGGNDLASQRRRLLQAQRVKEIYERLLSEGKDKVIVLGDLNDTPNSNALKPLIEGADLREVSEHPSFSPGEFHGKGTYGLGNDSHKIDYILLSPKLFERVIACGLFRKGAFPGKGRKRWSVYPELVEEIHAASDHHLIWVEIGEG